MQRSSMSGSRRSAQNGESEVPGSGAKKPRASAFYQQRLPAWNPVLTPAMIYVVLLSTGCLFIALGVALYVASDGVVELKYTYDGNGTVANCAGANGTNVKSCTISFKVPSDMAPPVYVYYELSNFYQNHRRYVQSRNYPQSMGTIYTDASSLRTCDPLIEASNGKILHPCGLIANSFFNDTFCPADTNCFPITSTFSGTNAYGWTEDGIAWPSDKATLFVPVAKANYATYSSRVSFLNDSYPNLYCGLNSAGVAQQCTPSSLLDVDNEHFIVWMRPASLPEFRKLYGKFTNKIPAGTTITFNVLAAFPVSMFSGTKSLVMTTLSWAGGKNNFLGIAYLVVGSLCIVVAGAFFARQSLCKGRELGDTSSLVWGTRR